MNLGRQLEGILEFSEGIIPETVDKALKETIEYFRFEYVEKGLDRAKKELEEAKQKQVSKSDLDFRQYVLELGETRKRLLDSILHGETTFTKTLAKVNELYEKRDIYAVLHHAFGDLVGGIFPRDEQCARLDRIITKLYYNTAR
ncbi:hypothetical protein JW756_02035 [Candidatus Woesearchaeota archaeon]|nr:hypothetical protein [Candidatus Woesearchaeota archaeon]